MALMLVEFASRMRNSPNNHWLNLESTQDIYDFFFFKNKDLERKCLFLRVRLTCNMSHACWCWQTHSYYHVIPWELQFSCFLHLHHSPCCGRKLYSPKYAQEQERRLNLSVPHTALVVRKSWSEQCKYSQIKSGLNHVIRPMKANFFINININFFMFFYKSAGDSADFAAISLSSLWSLCSALVHYTSATVRWKRSPCHDWNCSLWEVAIVAAHFPAPSFTLPSRVCQEILVQTPLGHQNMEATGWSEHGGRSMATMTDSSRGMVSFIHAGGGFSRAPNSAHGLCFGMPCFSANCAGIIVE